MNCFKLYDRSTGSVLNLKKVDEELCIHFGRTPDTDFWYRAWYDVIGLGLSLGHDWDALWERLPEYRDVIEFMRERYDFSAWAGRV